MLHVQCHMHQSYMSSRIFIWGCFEESLQMKMANGELPWSKSINLAIFLQTR